MISIREEITIASPPEAVWPLLSDPAVVASCIPGAMLTKAGDNGAYQGTMRVKFGPTVAQFRGEAKLATLSDVHVDDLIPSRNFRRVHYGEA